MVAEVPTTERELLIAALRHANDVGGLLVDIQTELSNATGDDADNPKYERLFDLLLRRWTDCSGVGLFIAAGNLDIELPDDMRGDDINVDDDGYDAWEAEQPTPTTRRET